MRAIATTTLLVALLFQGVASGQSAPRQGVPASTHPAGAGDAQSPTALLLPAAADDVVVGADGDCLLLPIARLRKIVVVDLTARRIAHYLNIESDDFSVVAGKTRAIVELADKKQLQRWNLQTGKLEMSAPLPDEPAHMALGHDSDGPLLFGTIFVDIASLKQKHMAVHHPPLRPDPDRPADQQWEGGYGDFDCAKAVAHPKGLGFTDGVRALVVTPQVASVYYLSEIGHTAPAEVGALFPASENDGFFGINLPAVRKLVAIQSTGQTQTKLLATMQNDYVLFLSFSGGLLLDPARYGEKNPWVLTTAKLCLARGGQERVCLDLPSLEETTHTPSAAGWFTGPQGCKHILMDVKHGRLTTMPVSGDRLIIRRIDVSGCPPLKSNQ